MLYGHKNGAHAINHNCNLTRARQYVAKVEGKIQKPCNYIHNLLVTTILLRGRKPVIGATYCPNDVNVVSDWNTSEMESIY
jgi:hypothetical protein